MQKRMAQFSLLGIINNFDFNIRFLKEEIARVESLFVDKLVLHPGSHVGVGVDTGLQNIIDSLNKVLNGSLIN